MKRWLGFIIILFAYSCKPQYVIRNDYLTISKVNGKSSPTFQFVARGGERHLSLIDWGEETIPVSSKSCHHGGEIVPPLKGFINATYDDGYIYLKISWRDLTKDSKSSFWREGALIEGKDDGISIVFSNKPDFNCALTCHMTNWEIDRGKFVSDYRMFNDKENNPIILLRSAKSQGRVITGMLGKEGKRNTNNKEFFIFNSERATGKMSSLYLYQIMGKDDKSVFKEKELFMLSPDNNYFEGKMVYRINQWSADIKIPLEFLRLKDVKKGDRISLSLALFDGTHVNHSITDTFSAVFD